TPVVRITQVAWPLQSVTMLRSPIPGSGSPVLSNHQSSVAVARFLPDRTSAAHSLASASLSQKCHDSGGLPAREDACGCWDRQSLHMLVTEGCMATPTPLDARRGMAHQYRRK